MAEYIDRNLIEWYGCYVEDAGCENRKCSGCSHAECSHTQVMQIPTAVVVERSEYEKLLKENEDLKETVKNCIDADSQSCEKLDKLYAKIDKAIEELEKYSESFLYRGRRELVSAVENCLEILKRCIGE